MLCLAPEAIRSRYRLADGGTGWDLTYNFLYREQTWRKFPAADGNFYHARNRNGDEVYKEWEFYDLFDFTLFTPVDYH